MRIVVIGGTGHIGSFLVPRLVRAGHDVVALSRGTQEPYGNDPAWQGVERVQADRAAEDAAGIFSARITALAPDAVVDLLCFTPESARALLAALRPAGTLLLHCGSIWVHGHGTEIPTTEEVPRRPFGEYGIGKAAVERLLLTETHDGGVPSVILHPGHISGPGWPVVNPQGNFDLAVWERLAAGKTVTLPNFGLETVHHVHADDVAQAFERALAAGTSVAGESFHVVSAHALTLRGFAEAVAGWFGREAVLEFAPFADFAQGTTSEAAAATSDHIRHSPAMSIDKARTLLGYRPRYSSLAAVAEAVRWQAEHGRITVPQMRLAPEPLPAGPEQPGSPR